MDDLLFNIIAVAAVAGFVLGIISGFWPALVISLVVVLLLMMLGNRLPR